MESNGSCDSKEMARRNSWQNPNIRLHAQPYKAVQPAEVKQKTLQRRMTNFKAFNK